MSVPFRLYVVAEGKTARDEVVLLAAKARDRIAVYWRQPTADDVPSLPDSLRAFETPLFVKESDLAAWPRLRGPGGAAGVHLKFDSATTAVSLRARFARPISIARSVHTKKEAVRALGDGVDLLVFGNVYETPSKAGAPGRGVDALREICEAAGKIPVFALGGITPERIPEVRAAGASGVATMRGLLGGREARDTLEAWLQALAVPA